MLLLLLLLPWTTMTSAVTSYDVSVDPIDERLLTRCPQPAHRRQWRSHGRHIVVVCIGY